MPKMKSHTGMGKRARVTGKGKLMHRQSNRNHLLEGKPSTRTRRLAGVADFAKADVKRIKRLLGR